MIFLETYAFKIDKKITNKQQRDLKALHFVSWIIRPNDITIVTINRDRLIEEMIHKLETVDATNEIRFCIKAIAEVINATV